MTTFFSKPGIQKALRYILAYALLCVFLVAGLFITESLRNNVLNICTWLKADRDLVYILYGWGSYILYLPYILSIVILETYLNTAVKTGKLWTRVQKVIMIEGGIGLVSILINNLLTH
jgi:hypothetical protein